VIRFIVDLYRGMIGLAFALGVVIAVAALAIDAGGMGALAALFILAATGLATGLSAVLLSINDHLAAIRDKRS